MEKARRTKIGEVVSAKNNKTIVVRVDSLKRHPKYKKSYKTSKKFQAHDPENAYQIGDKVEIEETRPISKNKHFKVVRKV